jgi:ABC-type antimicrobial peptide transport system permease subunit
MNDTRPAQSSDAPQVQQHAVSDGYFEAMGARLVSGRFFNDRDIAKNDGVIIVNESFAKRYGGGREIVGQHMSHYSGQIGPLGRNLLAVRVSDHWQIPALTIVGVVADVKDTALGQPSEPAMYFPLAQFPFRAVSVAVAARDTATATAAVRQALREVSPNTPVGAVDTWRHKFSLRTAEPQLLMTTLTAFGALSALLAALGVYGLFSWSVALRRRELAIRLTLGARPASVGASVVLHSAALVLVGLVAGWAIVRALNVPLTTVLFDVTPGDPASTITAAGLLLATSLIACVPPALRAMRVNPVEGLRNE